MVNIDKINKYLAKAPQLTNLLEQRERLILKIEMIHTENGPKDRLNEVEKGLKEIEEKIRKEFPDYKIE